MLFKTSEAHEEFRAKVRAFAEKEVKPIAFMLDQKNEQIPDGSSEKRLFPCRHRRSSGIRLHRVPSM